MSFRIRSYCCIGLFLLVFLTKIKGNEPELADSLTYSLSSFSTTMSPTNLLPYFDFDVPRNLTVTVGQTGFLHCRVERLGDKDVSWIRKRDLHILTAGVSTYTSDQRFQVIRPENSGNWTLQIKYPQPRDSGIYECQINTEPKMSLSYTFNVVELKANIVGPPDLYVKSGSDINLTCKIAQGPHELGNIFWYKGNEIIDATTNQNEVDSTHRITVDNDWEDGLTSRLKIRKAAPNDTGNYTCVPTIAKSSSVYVHVIIGMAFQRSHSKVWWGNFNSNSLYYDNNDYHSLDSNYKISGNLSRIQELDESTKSWNTTIHDSPGSLKSQDSGFSDNDDVSHGKVRHKPENQSNTSLASPSSIKTIPTPPTVVRRKPLQSPLNSARRISFSAPSSPTTKPTEVDLINQIDRLGLVANTPKNYNNKLNDSESSNCNCSNPKDRSIKRRRVIINRKTRRSLIDASNASAEVSLLSASSHEDNTQNSFKDYNNETVYLGGEEDGNNNSLHKSIKSLTTPSKYSTEEYKALFRANTSTPKTDKNAKALVCDIKELSLNDQSLQLYNNNKYSNPLLNGHSDSVQGWLDDIRMSYNHEVMSTLQTKSIAQEAFRNLKITTTTVAKIIRQLQTRSLILQGEFERVEKILSSETPATFGDCLVAAESLVESNLEFIKTLERRVVFFTDSYQDKKRFEDNIEHISLILRDLRISLEKHHYLDINSLNEDIQVLKRYVLITLRLVFEKLIRVIISNIESAKCDLVLRANLNMISTLSNMDYTGFASLNDAFMKNESIRVFLLICLDNKYSSVRALSLRALATICSTSESIKQFGDAGGVEIVKEILVFDPKRTEPERREAVSLLTQITAPWHGTGHKVSGLKDCLESIVESLTDIINRTTCCQTLLLCAASLNNLSRLEVTSIYSIMSNETVFKLKDAVEYRGPGVSIFLFEQIVGMLYNMSTNKKCHSHLANRTIINFITSIFQSQFYEKFVSRAENDSHHRTIKGILHIFSRLIHESVVGQEILENNFIPIFSKVERTLNKDNEYCKDISFITKQLNDSLSHKSYNRSGSPSTSNLRLNSSRHESFV